MNTEFKFGAVNISELGNIISDKLREYGISDMAELNVYLNKEGFKRVDEDLFYRMREDDSQEFIPSEGEIMVNFDNVKIIVKEKSAD